jgi:hypothetical protein
MTDPTTPEIDEPELSAFELRELALGTMDEVISRLYGPAAEATSPAATAAWAALDLLAALTFVGEENVTNAVATVG